MRDASQSRAGSSSPTKLGSSTASSTGEGSGITPKAPRTARPSMGGASVVTGLTASTSGVTARKSFGGPGTPTPASSIRRPASSMRNHTPDIPSVPPIPPALASSLTKEPETPSARRYSQLSRPATPSARPSSRMSNASGMRSVSRASSRVSLASGASSRLGHHRDELGTSATEATSSAAGQYTGELAEAREALQRATREAEQAKLELLEMTQDLKEERKRARTLHTEVNDLKRQAASSRLDEASAIDFRAEEAERHASALAAMQSEIDELKANLEAVHAAKSEGDASSAARIAGADAAERAREAAERERARLEVDLESLQSAGRQAIEIYQDKVDALEAQLFEQEAATAAARAEVRSAHSALAASTSAAASSRIDDSPEALLAASMGAGASQQRDEAQESALAIENDSLKAELEHQKSRFHRLEEELDDAKAVLEQEAEKASRRSKESLELADRLKKELKDSKNVAEKLKTEREQLVTKSVELEAALTESRKTLEAERGELELLRRDSGDRQSRQEGVESSERQAALLNTAENDRREAQAEVAKLKDDLEALQEELKLMEELRASDDTHNSSPAKDGSSDLRTQLEARDAELRQLRARLAHEIVPSISTEPTDTDTLPDSYNSSFGDMPTSPNSLSPAAHIRKKRDSNTSASSAGSHGAERTRGPIKTSDDKLADEVRGFKILLDQANEENSRLSATNQDLLDEAAKLRDAQRALEKTVAGLLDQLDEQSPMNGASKSPAGQRTLGQDTLEAEVAELKQKLKAVEKGHEREKSALNSEVAQLESLVEAKIFREDELEQQLADTRKALADLKGRSSSAVQADRSRETKTTIKASPPSTGRRSASAHSTADDDEGKCELCGDPHGIEVRTCEACVRATQADRQGCFAGLPNICGFRDIPGATAE